MWFWIMMALVWADEIQLRIAVDDRKGKRLDKPMLWIGDESVELTDDGLQPADVSGDRIFVGSIQIERKESLNFRLIEGETKIGELEVGVPMLDDITYQLKTTDTGLVIDLNAPTMPVKEEGLAESERVAQQLVLQAQSLDDRRSNTPGKIVCRLEIDASTKQLQQPKLRIGGEEEIFSFLDDGSLDGDIPGDQFWLLEIEIDPKESIQVLFLDEERSLAMGKISLPSAEVSTLRLKYNDFGLVQQAQEDLNSATALVVQAAPKGEDSSGEDQISLKVFLDDRMLQRLVEPNLHIEQEGFDSTPFKDDGEGSDAEDNDHLLTAEVTISREEFVQLRIEDKKNTEGQLTVFLPSTSEAIVWLRTTDSGIKMVTEPLPSQGSSQSTTPSSTVGGSSGTITGTDRLAHVLWVAIALFSIAFAYVRRLVSEHWTEEIQPTLKKMNQFLDEKQEEE